MHSPRRHRRNTNSASVVRRAHCTKMLINQRNRCSTSDFLWDVLLAVRCRHFISIWLASVFALTLSVGPTAQQVGARGICWRLAWAGKPLVFVIVFSQFHNLWRGNSQSERSRTSNVPMQFQLVHKHSHRGALIHSLRTNIYSRAGQIGCQKLSEKND